MDNRNRTQLHSIDKLKLIVKQIKLWAEGRF